MSTENVKKLKKTIRKAEKLGIDIQDLPAIKNRSELHTAHLHKKLVYFASICVVICALIYNKDLFNTNECIIAMPNMLSHALRKPEDCQFCHNVTEIVRIANTSPMEFEQNFAYNAKPVIVTDATANWTALSTFNYWYFKDVYETALLENEQMNCQFFPYTTDFRSLYEALNMPSERVNYDSGTEPWYFGWSNCNYDVAQQLRQHYGRPYFLPETSENNAIDWIFMGGPGLGAHMHVDNVRLPSWQAQIKGAKEWILAPPPECYYECYSFSAVVHTGDIIILDTNKWYHKTIVLPGEISITIGAEYD